MTIPEPRPSATVVASNGGIYRSIQVDKKGRTVTEEFYVELVGHRPCGWECPVWPDEAEATLQVHLLMCKKNRN